MFPLGPIRMLPRIKIFISDCVTLIGIWCSDSSGTGPGFEALLGLGFIIVPQYVLTPYYRLSIAKGSLTREQFVTFAFYAHPSGEEDCRCCLEQKTEDRDDAQSKSRLESRELDVTSTKFFFQLNARLLPEVQFIGFEESVI